MEHTSPQMRINASNGIYTLFKYLLAVWLLRSDTVHWDKLGKMILYLDTSTPISGFCNFSKDCKLFINVTILSETIDYLYIYR